MKYMLMAVSSNFGNMLSMAGAALFLPFLPMTAIQILLNNFIYDVSQTAIPLDRVDDEDAAAPRAWDMRQVVRAMLTLGPVSSVFDFITFALLIFVFKASEGEFHSAWFTESLATQCLVVFVIRTQRPFWRSRPHPWVAAFALCGAGLGFLIPMTPLGAPFGLQALPLPLAAAIVILIVAYLASAELAKHVFLRRRSEDGAVAASRTSP